MSENIENNKAARGSISQIILKALSNGDKYGYEICKDIEKLTDGKLILKQPSLYSSLRRMEEQDLISSYWKDSLIGGRRHYYSLTSKGKEIFEENKKVWQDDKTLLNNLPLKEINELNFSLPLSGNLTDEKTQHTSVLNQENLFNLNRTLDREIKKIDALKAEQDDEFNKSYFQFDFFEQNIKFVKEDSKQKQEVSAFKNRFSDMDNYKEEIEPENRVKIEKTFSAFNKKQPNLKEINNDTSPQTHEKEAKITTYSENKTIISQPVLKNTYTKIERHDVFKDNAQHLNDIKEPSLTLSHEKSETSLKNEFSQEDKLFKNTEACNIEKTSGESTEKRKNDDMKKDINIRHTPATDSIRWDFETNLSNSNSLFDENDYKDAIGRLYYNSRLQDPYEQNKFQTFKEIFPSSQFNINSQVKKVDEDLNKTSFEVDAKNRIDNYLKSSEESNIDCEDIKNLNSLYNLQGVEIKIHNSTENKKSNKVYTDKNKLNMVSSWINSLIMLVEILFAYLLLKNNYLIVGKQPFIYFLAIVCTLTYCIISTMENIFDRFRLIVIEKTFNKTFMQRLFGFIVLTVVIFALNIAFGMTSLIEIKYLSYWLVPLLLSTNLLSGCLVYYLLLKSKNFNS